jgi:ribosomal protein S24E
VDIRGDCSVTVPGTTSTWRDDVRSALPQVLESAAEVVPVELLETPVGSPDVSAPTSVRH